jgi:uncharacterized membrane protein
MITNHAVVVGILLVLLAIVFQLEKRKELQVFFTYVPGLLLCYFLPAILNTAGFFSEKSIKDLYFVASRYMLPASLILMTISIDVPALFKLGPKALIMFFTATLGIILGGAVALWVVSSTMPEIVNGTGNDAAWRGMSTIAGSWIGGGANQLAMKETFNVSDKLFSAMAVVDVVTANIWMACLLYGVGIHEKMDKWLKADNSAIKELEKKMADYQASVIRIPTSTDLMMIVAIAFGGTAIAHAGADVFAPFLKKNVPILEQFSLTDSFIWVVLIVTTLGLLFSFVPSVRSLEGAGASKVGSVFLYFMVACVGMKMNFIEIYQNLGFFFLGVIWMLTHCIILLSVAKLIKAPFFFVAVGSQANIGGAASAPVVASAFNPVLAPVGVLLAMLGYAVGTYGAIISGYLMKFIHNP